MTLLGRRDRTRAHQLAEGEIFVTVVMACLLLFGTALLVYGIASGDEPSGSESTLAGWIEALATLAGFGAASAAAIYAARVVGVERQRDHRRQASTVAAWIHQLNTLDVKTPAGEVSHGVNGADLRLRNASDVPVTGLQFAVFFDGGTTGTPTHVIHGELNLAPPAGEPQEIPMRLDTYEYRPWAVLGVSNPNDLSGHCHVELSFIDAQGIRWHRNALGVLNEVSMDFTVIPTADSPVPKVR